MEHNAGIGVRLEQGGFARPDAVSLIGLLSNSVSEIVDGANRPLGQKAMLFIASAAAFAGMLLQPSFRRLRSNHHRFRYWRASVDNWTLDMNQRARPRSHSSLRSVMLPSRVSVCYAVAIAAPTQIV